MIRFMDRMFLPVGQGAFYCERFHNAEQGRNLNVVYDCGTLSGMCMLDRELNRVFAQDEIIDAVFISHLHEDHFNGLERLSKRCKIQRIYLPCMETLGLRLMQLDYITRKHMTRRIYGEDISEGFSDSVLDDPHEPNLDKNILRDKLLRLIKPIGNDDHFDFRGRRVDRKEHIFFVGAPESPQEEVFVGSSHGSMMSFTWRYKAFSIMSEDDEKVVIAGLKSLIPVKWRKDPEKGPLENLIAELIQKVKEEDKSVGERRKKGKKLPDLLNKIRNVYNRIGSNHFNVNSLMLYSGCDKAPVPVIVGGFFDRTCPETHCCANGKTGCLYTGDFDAQKHWNELNSKLTQAEWQTIGCIQIPHHGSEGNFNNNFLNESIFPAPAPCHVISAGLGNQYLHPSKSVLKKYDNQKRCFPAVVTQDPRSLAAWFSYLRGAKGSDPFDTVH